ncbi:tRNA(1)(Val) (adenine(37)-N(6))-methyltransferase [Shewanella sp. OPT22]|nr:tRNA(1)(Val) (adenine(37)-N(6))-methyltransferase [Shewanella sp. OPT22]
MPFSFKQFHIDDSQCGMKVSTDSVILGAWAPLTHANNILDIGTGSGLLALMSAQRSQANIFAIELDAQACKAAKVNVEQSPWAHRVKVIQDDIIHYAAQHGAKFEHIICNPPYFLIGPQTQQQNRANARHTNTLSYQDLIDAIEALLSDNGTASLILPTEVADDFFSLIESSGLNLSAVKAIIPVEGSAQRRVLFSLSRVVQPTQFLEPLILRGKQNQYTDEMIELSKDFYLNL